MSKRFSLIFMLMLVFVAAFCSASFGADAKPAKPTFAALTITTQFGKPWSGDLKITSKVSLDACDVTAKSDILDEYGITFEASPDGKLIHFNVSADEATPASGIKIPVTAENEGGSAKGTVVLKITGNGPSANGAFDWNGEGKLFHTYGGKFASTDILALNSSDVNTSIDLKSLDVALPLTWKVSKLPDGLEYEVSTDPHMLMITGTPTKAGEYKYSIEVTNKNLKSTKKIERTVQVLPVLEAFDEPKELKALTVGKTYKAKESISGVQSYDIVILPNEVSKSVTVKVDGVGDAKKLFKQTVEIEITDKQLKTVPPEGSIDIQIRVSNDVSTKNPVSFDYLIPVNAVAPKLGTKSLKLDYGKAATSSNGKILFTGTLPISFDLDIDDTAFSAAFPDSSDIATNITDSKTRLLKLGLEVIRTGNVGVSSDVVSQESFVTLSGSPTVSVKKFPLKFTLKNKANEDGVAGTVNLDIGGTAPSFVKAAPKDAFTVLAGTSMDLLSADLKQYLQIKGSPQIKLSVKGLPDDIVLSTDAFKMDSGGVWSGEYFDGLVPDAAKKYSVTVTAENGAGKASQKFTFEAVQPVTFPEGHDLLKEATYGKKYSGTVKLESGGKNLEWAIEANPGTGLIGADDLKNNYGITIDKTKGTITASTFIIKNTVYSPDISFVLNVSNDKSFASRDVSLDIVLPKAKLTTPKIPNAEVRVGFGGFGKGKPTLIFTATGTYQPVIYLMSNDVPSSNDLVVPGVSFEPYLAGYDWTKDPSKTTAAIWGTPTALTEGKQNFTVRVANEALSADSSHYVEKKLSITVIDQLPQFKKSSYSVGKLASSDASMDVYMRLWKGTGSYNWTAKAPKGVDFEIQSADANPGSADVRMHISTSGAKTGKNTITVTATNANDNKKASVKVEFTVDNNSVGANYTGWDAYDGNDDKSTAKPLLNKAVKIEVVDVTYEDDSTEAVEEEGTVLILGAARDADDLTESEKKALEGYVIAAILPEITVNEAGQYDLEVDLEEKIPAGAKLEWFAFPRDAEENEDDEIVDFADKDGEPTEVVPEDHFVVVSPWFNADVTYAPVIAVKADEAKEEAKSE